MTTSFIPLSDEEKVQAKFVASEFVNAVCALDTSSPEFEKKISEIQALATDEFAKEAELTRQMLSNVFSTDGERVKRGVAVPVNKLRLIQKDFQEKRSVFGVIPGDSNLATFIRGRAMRKIIAGMPSAVDEIRKDSAAMNLRKADFWNIISSLSKSENLVREIAEGLSFEVNRLMESGENERATELESTLLFAAKSRNQDILARMAVAVQSYISLGIIVENNTAVLAGLEKIDLSMSAA